MLFSPFFLYDATARRACALSLSLFSFFSLSRASGRAAADIIIKMDRMPDQNPSFFAMTIIEENLAVLESDPRLWTQTTRAMMLDLPGWAGYFKRMEQHPSEAPKGVTVRLLEFMAVHSILMRSSIEDLARQNGWDSEKERLSDYYSQVPRQRKGEKKIFGMGPNPLSLQNPSGLAYTNQNFDRMEKLCAQPATAYYSCIILSARRRR